MGLRTRAILLGVATYLASPLGLALGLGEIKVNSHLNQPLEAEIQLLQTRELTAQEILVGLGSREDFERVGVERPFFLNDLKFTVDMNSPNGPVIRIKSNRLVKEPFLNFIVQAQWPSGKLLREFTVLMDLPVFSNQPARAVKAAEAKSPVVQQARPQRPQPQPARRTPAPASQTRGFDGDTYGPVSSTDTLWSIASKAKPGDDVSVQQTMLAIQRLNPDAFINNNINLLKRGAVLRLPTEADITEFDPRQAKREVASQNRSVQAPEAQIDATRSTVERAPAADKVQGRVKLTSASEITGSKSGSGSGEGEQDADALRTQLLSTQEELAATKRENEDLNARVQSMDEQVKTMEKLLEVANADLRKLELALAEQQRLEAEAAANGEQVAIDDSAAAETTETATEATETPVDAEPVETETVAEPETESAVKPEQKPEAKPAEPIAPPAAEKKSIIDVLMDYIYFIGGGLVLLIGGLVYFLLTRRDSFDDEDFDYDEDHMPEEDPIAAASDDTVLDDGQNFAIAGFDTSDSQSDDSEPEITLDSLESELLKSSAPDNEDRTVLAEDAYGDKASSEDYNELDTTLQFDAISEADIEAAAAETESQLELADDHTVLDLPEETRLDTGFGAQDDLADLDADLELDLDVELDDTELSLDSDLDDSFDATEESLTAEVDFGDLTEDLATDTSEDEASELSLDLDENALGLDLEDDGEAEELSLDIDLDDEITSSRGIEEGDDELDLTNLVAPTSSDAADLDLSVDEDLSLGDDFELGDDLELDEDLSLDAPSLSDTQTFDVSDLDAALEASTTELDELEEVADLGLDAAAPVTELASPDEDLDDLDDELDKLASDFEGDFADLDDDLAGLDETIAESSLEESAPVVEPEALTEAEPDEKASSDDITLLPEFDPDSDDDSEPSFLGDSDEVATKIDLLRVFVDMGDTESALNTLEEIREEGNDAQKKEAEELFAELG